MRSIPAEKTIGPATYPPAPRTTSGRRRRMMRAQDTGAAAARPSARASRGPGRRGKPSTRKRSTSNPAEARRGESRLDANRTAAPRALRASAIASAGRTCPAVPPAAMRHLSCCCAMARGDVKEDSDGGEADDEARAPVGHERKRDSGQRGEPHHSAHVHGRLSTHERRDPRRESLAEGIAAPQRDVEAGVPEDGEGSDDPERAEETKLLADDREDHVRGSLGQVVDLLHALAEPDSEEAARPERDHRLDGLKARSFCVCPRVEEAEDPCAPVRLEPDRGEHDRERDST